MSKEAEEYFKEKGLFPDQQGNWRVWKIAQEYAEYYHTQQSKVEGSKTAEEILNEVEPNGELLTTEMAVKAMKIYNQQSSPTITDEVKGFIKSLKEDRATFVSVVSLYTVDNHKELRTVTDTLLIAFDQAVERLTPTVTEKLIEVQKGYIKFLANAEATTYQIAHIHGFRHSEDDKGLGKAFRNKISELTAPKMDELTNK